MGRTMLRRSLLPRTKLCVAIFVVSITKARANACPAQQSACRSIISSLFHRIAVSSGLSVETLGASHAVSAEDLSDNGSSCGRWGGICIRAEYWRPMGWAAGCYRSLVLAGE
ncbi:hypothetical protein P280DRAFT_180998 [Massarina eburnea CBS 473.64]|uniref:Secreted protein n=1 Tax=Massarina eburnea CBS 473.64 TaxID=1395130 RepID=A0A6A6SAM5_9PLEO|nr:hypothetical protein P280DRAFT_180998 [Massarina eburnea CBS 473.64]